MKSKRDKEYVESGFLANEKIDMSVVQKGRNIYRDIYRLCSKCNMKPQEG